MGCVARYSTLERESIERDPYPSEQRKHETAMRTVLLNLPSHERRSASTKNRDCALKVLWMRQESIGCVYGRA